MLAIVDKLTKVVKLFGLPRTIVGDRDPRWTSDVWKALAQLFGTRLALSTSKHPQTDGQTEVMNQHMETMLRAYVQADQKDWSSWLDTLQLAYNNSTHSSHKMTPAQLLLGYKPRMPLDYLSEEGQRRVEGLPRLESRIQELEAHRDSMRDALKRSADKQAYQYDKGR